MENGTTDPAVALWFNAQAEGHPFGLLHPGGTDSRALGPLVDELAGRYRVLTPDQRAHGHTPDPGGPLSYAVMAEDTIAFLENEAEIPVHLLGCSDGAVIALTVALERPDLVRDLVVVAKLDRMHAAEPVFTDTDLAGLEVPVLVVLGDDDEVRLEHAVAMYRALPHGELAVVPHASHGVLVEKPDLCARLITDFHVTDKPGTFAPIRRRPGP